MFAHSFTLNKYLSNNCIAYCASGTVLGMECIVPDKIDKVPGPVLTSYLGKTNNYHSKKIILVVMMQLRREQCDSILTGFLGASP